MEEQSIALEELLQLLPALDLSKNRKRAGGPIPADKAVEKISDYIEFKRKHSSIKNQTCYVGFDSERLITYLQNNRPHMDELRVYLSLDKSEKKFNVVLWPFKDDDPAFVEKGGKKLALPPYNIGNRRP